MELCDITLMEASQGLQKKQFSAVDLTESCLKRIKSIDPKVKAFITVTEDSALEQARRADERIARQEVCSPLLGIPVAFKDIYSTKEVETTAGSNMLKGYIPPFNATVVEKITNSGSVMMGKTNLDAFAHGSSNENSDFFPTRNSWDLQRVPGGSSGGSAVAVSIGASLFATGTDTGSSVRLPASFCNLTGLKPTYGLISRFGVVAMGSSVDTIGPFTKTVEDLSLVLEAMAGWDPKDSVTTKRELPAYSKHLTKSLKGLRIGLPKEYFAEGLDSRIKDCVHQAARKFESLGMRIEEVTLPYTKYGLAVYYILIPSEISANLARHDGIRYHHSVLDDQTQKIDNIDDIYYSSRGKGFGAEAKRRIILGTYALSSGYYDAYYEKAMKVRTLVVNDFKSAFQKVDILLTPTSPTLPFKLGEKTNNPLEMYLSDVFTVPMNIAGIPGLNIPCGFVDGLPVGMQLVGPQFSEETLLQAGYAYQQITDWHTKKPPIITEGV